MKGLNSIFSAEFPYIRLFLSDFLETWRKLCFKIIINQEKLLKYSWGSMIKHHQMSLKSLLQPIVRSLNVNDLKSLIFNYKNTCIIKHGKINSMMHVLKCCCCCQLSIIILVHVIWTIINYFFLNCHHKYIVTYIVIKSLFIHISPFLLESIFPSITFSLYGYFH